MALVSLVMVAPGIIGSLDPASLVIGLASLATIILGLALGVHRFR